MQPLSELARSLCAGDDASTVRLTRAAIDAGTPPEIILSDGLIAGMKVIGEQFRRHEVFLPAVLLAARAMHRGMELLRPLLAAAEVSGQGTVVLGTVRGDVHDIGKNLVAIMLEGAGYEVVDLGHDVPAERFVEAVEQSGARVVGLSALLTTTMSAMADVIAELTRHGLREPGTGSGQAGVRVLVGGAPLNAEIARSLGADAYCPDASSAAASVASLLEE